MRHQRRHRLYSMLAKVLLALFFAFAVLGRSPLHAQTQVVTDCATDADLRAKLTAMQTGAGGTLTFACGTGTVTIVLSGVLPTIARPTVIDGGGRISLSGGNASRLFIVAADGSLTLRNIRLTRGLSASDGGAIHATGALALESVTFEENSSTSGSGGALVAYGPLTIRNSRFVGNQAVNGGAVYPRHGATVEIQSTTFSENQATGFTGRGGAILVWDGPRVRIANSTFVENTSAYAGGAVSLTGNVVLTVTETLFEENESSNSGSAIENNGTLLLDRSLLVGNQNGAQGTGGVLFNAGAATIVNTTFSSNRGTAIDTWSAHTTTLRSSTIYANQSYGFQAGYGILSASGTTNMHNTILAANTTNCQIYSQGVLVSQGFNISSDTSCALFSTADRREVDPMLGPLANNGGVTRSHFPLPGSPAIDEGQCIGSITVDQRGMPRPTGDTCDIGAVEVSHAVWLATGRR